MSGPAEYQQWMQRLKAFSLKKAKELDLAGQHVGRNQEVMQQKKLQYEREIAKWVAKNPPPKEAPKPATYKTKPLTNERIHELQRNADWGHVSHTLEIDDTVETVKDVEKTADTGRTIRRMRRGQQGASTIGLAAMGGLGGVGLAVVKIALEEIAFSIGEKVLSEVLLDLRYALMPNTRAEAERAYQKYCIHNGVTSPGYPYVSPTGETPTIRRNPLMSKEEWLRTTYGIRWDTLR